MDLYLEEKIASLAIIKAAILYYSIGCEYGMTPGGDGEHDKNPYNSLVEIDCRWLVAQACHKADYRWITADGLGGQYADQFFSVTDFNDVGRGDLVRMRSKDPKGTSLMWYHVGLMEGELHEWDGGYWGQIFDSEVRPSTPEEIKNGRTVYGPGPHHSQILDYPGGFNDYVDRWWSAEIPGKNVTISCTDFGGKTFSGYARIKLADHSKKIGKSWKPNPRDPLVLNLDGQGIQTLSIDEGIRFDQDANGFKELSGWVAPGSGVLMIDWNGNTQIHTASKLFTN